MNSQRAGETVVLTRHVGDGVQVAAMIDEENGKILGIGDKHHYRDCGARPPVSVADMQNFWSQG